MKSLLGMFARRIEQVRGRPRLMYSIVGFLIVIVLATILLSLSNAGQTYKYSIGDIANEDVRVTRNIHYIKEEESRIAEKGHQKRFP